MKETNKPKKRAWKRHTCGECRHYHKGYCAIYAKRMVAAAPSCKFGSRAICSDKCLKRYYQKKVK